MCLGLEERLPADTPRWCNDVLMSLHTASISSRTSSKAAFSPPTSHNKTSEFFLFPACLRALYTFFHTIVITAQHQFVFIHNHPNVLYSTPREDPL